ncbi:MAG: hypothetical protein ACK47B_26495 [Armatimonadota bacterium]
MRGRAVKWMLGLLLVVLPLVAAGWVVRARIVEDDILARAQTRLEAGHWGAASQALRELPRGFLLSGDARRRAAALHFRLGEDRQGHQLLVGQRFDDKDPADRRVRDLSARCQRVSLLLKQVEASRDPEERVRLLRQARDEVPEAPHLLRRLAQEELLASVATGREQYQQAFEQAYLELRARAPEEADALKTSVGKLLNGEKAGETPLTGAESALEER